MPHNHYNTLRPADVLNTLRTRHRQLAIPVIAITAVALVYAVFRTPTWEAVQAMVVRDEAATGALRPGKFSVLDDMKVSQETVLELGHSRSVLEQALIAVGPPAKHAGTQWPTTRDIENLEGAIKLSPPKGAEFGKTEVFYLKVQHSDPRRAVALASEVAKQLQHRFEKLREQKAHGISSELEKTVSLAEADLNNSTARLSKIERAIGSDLAELRILNDHPSGDSDLRRNIIELEKELRVQEAARRSNLDLLQLLKVAQVDPGRLLASPSRLLKSQPGLERLKSGLVDAQLRTAQLLGKMDVSHPQVLAAQAAEQEISEHLHDEIEIAMRGVQLDLRLTDERVQALKSEHASVQQRLDRLAGVRADYANLVSEVHHRTDILKTAQQELAEARAGWAASRTASLLNTVDRPEMGSQPIGPGRTTIALAGLLAGILTSATLVFLWTSPTAAPAPIVVRPAAQPIPTAGLTFKQALQRVAANGNGRN